MKRKSEPESGAARELVRRCVPTPIGEALIAATVRGIARLEVGTHEPKRSAGTARLLQKEPDSPASPEDRRRAEAHADRAEAQLAEYFAGKRKTFDLPLDLHGTPGQMAVWNALLEIPYGRTMTYGELARRAGMRDAARAAGAACGSNPVWLVVPCHRVIGHNGSLTGYGGGLWRKKALLEFESGKQRLPLSQ